MSAAWFDGHVFPLPVKPGTRDHRERARHGTAVMVTRNNGTADDLRLILTLLDLWPATDPS